MLMDFKPNLEQVGQERENSYLRRLYRVLQLPVGDLKPRTEIIKAGNKMTKRCTENPRYTYVREKMRKLNVWIRYAIGINELPVRVHTGYKSITRKSLNFDGSRYQDTLIQIAKMCKENSLTDFVGDLSDITVLLNSMSPSVEDLLKNTFTESEYTKKIRNLDMKIGQTLKVVGSAT